MADTKRVTYDVDGYAEITDAILKLLNQYPDLGYGEEIRFAHLNEDSGIAMYAGSGAVIAEEHRSITGRVDQKCTYRFNLVYRSAPISESRRATIAKWLDNIGCWIEGQTITSMLDGNEYTLDAYPPLTGGREFVVMQRDSGAHLESINANNTENWVISLSACYKNDFYRRQIYSNKTKGD